MSTGGTERQGVFSSLTAQCSSTFYFLPSFFLTMVAFRYLGHFIFVVVSCIHIQYVDSSISCSMAISFFVHISLFSVSFLHFVLRLSSCATRLSWRSIHHTLLCPSLNACHFIIFLCHSRSKHIHTYHTETDTMHIAYDSHTIELEILLKTQVAVMYPSTDTSEATISNPSAFQ